MINNIKSKYIKRLSFKNIRKGLISIAIISSILVSPFSIYADEETYYMIPIQYQSIYNYFFYHGYRSYTSSINSSVSNNHTDFSGTLSCTGTSVDSTGSRYCTVWNASNLDASNDNGALIVNYLSSSLSGTYTSSSTSFNGNYAIYVPKGASYIFMWGNFNGQPYTMGTGLNNNYENVYPVYYIDRYSNVTSVNDLDIKVYNTFSGGMRWHALRITNPSTSSGGLYMSFELTGNMPSTVFPLYSGYENGCPDEVYYLLFPERTNGLVVSDKNMYGLIESGNSSSQSASNNLSNVSNDLTSGINNLNSVNETLENDMSSALQNVDTNSLLLQSQNFIKSMNWVKVRFNTMFNNNPLGWYIQISLIIGIAIFMIGRYRK